MKVLCPYCGESCGSASGMLMHITNRHPEIKIRDIKHLEERLSAIGMSLEEFIEEDVAEIINPGTIHFTPTN